MTQKTFNPVTVSPGHLKANDRLGFKIIAVIGTNNDWCAYRGLTDWDDEKVAKQGDVIKKEAAEALFYAPTAAELIYRNFGDILFD